MSRAAGKWALAALCVYLLYFYGLGSAGLVGPDEPRYASIGREMARSGDWITPRLWGEPWFEKPALLYWMIAAGFRAGLPDPLAPRLPVTLVSLAFLAFYYRVLAREFGEQAACFAVVILGTTAGWLGYSHAAVTDLPMAAAFAASMLLSLRWLGGGDRRILVPAAALLGLAVLAKGMVPLVLAAPLAWMGRRRWKDLLRPEPLSAFLLVAAPWYVLCYHRNGAVFLEEFFWRHHVERFSTEALLHQQPFWFYIPVLLGGLLPWTPVFLLLARRKLYADSRRRFLLLWLAFGLVFFSASTNKLPGYLLPLLPAACALMGLALAEAGTARSPLAASAALLALAPPAAGVLPQALLAGLSRANWAHLAWPLSALAAIPAVLAWRWSQRNRDAAVLAVGLAAVAGIVYLKAEAFPRLEELVSARPVWRAIATRPGDVCAGKIHRSFRYGLNYYTVNPLPDCAASPRPVRIEQQPGRPPRPVT